MKKIITLLSLLFVSLLMVGAVSAGMDAGAPRACEDVDFCTWTTSLSSFSLGKILPLGTDDYTYSVFWKLNTNATATCNFDATGLNPTSAELHISIDNDVTECTLNGNPISGSAIVHEGLAPADPRGEHDLTLDPADLNAESNEIICSIVDRGGMSYFNACVTGDYETDAPEVVMNATPEYPTCESDMTVCATVTDASPISFVDISCTADGTTVTKADVLGVGDQYCADFSESTMNPLDNLDFTCTVEAEDVLGNNATVDIPNPLATYDCMDPVADANGPYTCNESDTNFILLNASGSTDTVDTSLYYEWDLDGNGDFETLNVVSPEFLCLDDGVETVTVRVTDDAGHTDEASSTVTITNVAPVAVAGVPYTGDEGSNVSLAANATDVAADMPIVNFTWDLDNDGVFETIGQNVNFACVDDLLNYPVTVKATDKDLGVGTSTATVTCNNVAPVVDAGADQTVDENDTVTVAPAFTDVGTLDTHTVEVNWGSGYGSDLTHVYCDNGIYTVTVRVTDDDGGIGTDTLTVTVNNLAPSFDNLDASAIGVIENPFSFDADASDIGCDVLTYSLVSFPSGMTINTNTGMISWTPSASQSGDHVVIVGVNDGDASVNGTLNIHIYDYKIDLDSGWNLMSIPLVPEDDDTSIGNVFGGAVLENAEVVWSYQDGKWKYNRKLTSGDWSTSTSRVQDIFPGWGYYVKMANGTTLYQDGKDNYGVGVDSVPMPPQVDLTKGWNLVGHYGLPPKPVYCSLSSLIDTTIGYPRWSALFGYDASANSFISLGTGDLTNFGRGYWLEMDVDDGYNPSTTCVGIGFPVGVPI